MKILFHDIDSYEDMLVMNALLYDFISKDNDSYCMNIDGVEYHIRIHASNFIQYRRSLAIVATSWTDIIINLYCNKEYEKTMRKIFSKYC